jgi:SAM-dependent methyltransferase
VEAIAPFRRASRICDTLAGVDARQPGGSAAPKDQWTSGPAYEAWMGRWSRLLAVAFLDWLAAPAGSRWLDVCCGGGALTGVILARCRPALVRGIDRSPAQIEFARRQSAHPFADFRLGDATALPFGDADFDFCVCGLGLNFLPDALAALGEMRRVTRPGGTIAAYVWDYAGKMRFLREFWDVALKVDPEAEAFDQGRRFSICSPEGLQVAFRDAGFSAPASRDLDITTQFSSFEEYWAGFQLLQGSAPVYLASRNERIREAIRGGLKVSLPAQPDGSIVLSARALAIRAQRP